MAKISPALVLPGILDAEIAAAELDSVGVQLVEAAQEAHEAQDAALDGLELTSAVEGAVALLIEAKQEQIERIEDRLESLIEQHTAQLTQTMARRPKIPFPGARAKWQQQQAMQVTSLQRLNDRLDAVREIRNDVGVHTSKVEELAMAKLKHQQPELVAEWEDMKQAERRHQELMRQKNKRDRRQEEAKQSRSSGRVLTRIIAD